MKRCTTTRVIRLLVAAPLLLVLAACDDSPKGPGSFTVSVEWDSGAPPVGAAIVFLSGVGLGEITPQGGTLAWSHSPPGDMGGIRVVVVDTGTPTSLRFTLPVSELKNGTPAATLLDLAGQDNELIAISSRYRVRVF
jgi:hypothetical protein